MRHLYCAPCGERYPGEGRRELFARTAEEPAEHGRVVRGFARTPTPQQRTMFVDGTPHPLAPGQFECDLCNVAITPGESAVAVTIWREDQQEPPAWEHDYVTGAADDR